MSWYKCLLGSMPWCKCSCSACHDANVHLGVCHECKCPLVGMPWCECFDANTIYSKFPLFSKIKASSAFETKIFSNLDLLFLEKSSSFFWLKAPKKLVITIRNLWIGHWLEIWWSSSKDLFSQFGQKEGTCSRPFSRKTNSLKIKHLKKIHFSSSLWIWQYDRRQDPPW